QPALLGHPHADLDLAAYLGAADAPDLPEILTLLHRDDVVGERRDGARHLVGLGLCGVEPAREGQEGERGQGQRLQLEHAVLLSHGLVASSWGAVYPPARYSTCRAISAAASSTWANLV